MQTDKCAAWTAKIFLLIFNSFLFCCGASLIGVGAWLVANDNGLLLDLELTRWIYGGEFLTISAKVLLSFGCLMVVTSIVGIVVGCIESPHVFVAYIVLLTVCCIGSISGGAVSLAYKDHVLKNIGKNLLSNIKSLENSYYNPLDGNICSASRGSLWDFIQLKYDCCGVGDGDTGYKEDYKFSADTSRCDGKAVPSSKVPFSCCSNIEYGDTDIKTSAWINTECQLHKQGCGQKIVNAVFKFSLVLIGIGIGFGMFIMFGIVFAVCLCQNPTKTW